MSKENTFSFLIHFQFLNNRHKCMKVVDEKGEICCFIIMCHLLKGLSPKFHIFRFLIPSQNLVAY
jgi:hypothetical protein